MKLTLRVCDWMGDWYVIEKAEHDGRGWMEPTEYGFAYMTSARISDADVEGTSGEMLAIAAAIEARGEVSFKRCAMLVREKDGEVDFESPRNSTKPGTVSLADADALAKEIREMLS